MMKILISLFIIFLSFPVSGQWKKLVGFDPVNSRYPGSSEHVESIYVLDKEGAPNIIFAGMGASGDIWRSSDGGTSWLKSQVPDSGISVFAFAFKNAETGWAAIGQIQGKPYGRLLKTTDGGITWFDLNIKGDHSAIYYNKSNGLLLLASWETDLSGTSISSDEGLTWKQVSKGHHTGFAFSDDLHGVCSVLEDNWIITSDGGYTWKEINFSQECWQPVAIPGSISFLAYNENSLILWRSDNYGASWHQIFNRLTRPDVPPLTGIVLIDSCGNLFAQTQGALGKGILYSKDYGINWITLDGPSLINDSRFYVTNNGIFAADWHQNMVDSNYIWKLPLANNVSLAAIDIYADTIGGTFSIPILSKGGSRSSFDIRMSYDTTNLIYDGTYTINGIQVDERLTGSQSYLHILPNISDTLALARFQVFPINGSCSEIKFDSVNITSALSLCSLQSDFTATICFPSCIGAISKFLRYYKVPILGVFPNPASSNVIFSMNLREPSFTTLKIYNPLGNEVATLVNKRLPAGDQRIEFDASHFPSGVYYYRLEIGEYNETKPMIVVH